ncbi:hypothetical protein [Reyranella sp.]|uniref:hypothetical protein n=1 Tax=Reyranella sp. TaxID=1929291 RepID=UPI003F72FFD5
MRHEPGNMPSVSAARARQKARAWTSVRRLAGISYRQSRTQRYSDAITRGVRTWASSNRSRSTSRMASRADIGMTPT